MSRAKRVDPETGDEVVAAPPFTTIDDLDFLNEAAQGEGVWFIERYKTAAEMRDNPRGQPVVFVTKVPAPLDIGSVHQEFGGGVYRFKRQMPGGFFSGSRVIEMDGPPRARTFDPPPPATPVGVPPLSPAVVQTSTQSPLDKIMSRLEAIENKIAEPKPTGLGELVAALVSLDTLRAKQTPPPVVHANPEKEIVNTYFAMIEKGMELRDSAERPAMSDGGTDWVRAFEAAAPLVDKLLAGLARRRVVVSPNGAVHPTAPSHAEVIDPAQPAAPAAPPVEDLAARRWGSVVDALARAITASTDPELFADGLLVMLEPFELDQLRMASTEQVMAELQTSLARYPVLGSANTRPYLDRVLETLRTPPEAGDDSESGESSD